MSYAVETKKRKFHRVLESLTKPSTPSPAKSTASEPPATGSSTKKARLDTDNLSIARSSILKVTRPTSRDSSVSSPSRPSFVPWDRERFLERLETFRRVDRWAPKPAAISEVEWAKRGWVCTDVARVTCVGGCGGSVVVKLPDELDELDGFDGEKVQERKDVRAQLVNEYANMLVKGHGDSCPWRNKGCDATIHRIPLANPESAISGLQTRYSNLVKMADQLPAQDVIQTPESFDLEKLVSTLPAGFNAPHEEELSIERDERAETPTPQAVNGTQDPAPPPSPSPSPSPSFSTTAFTLAFFGWDTVPDGTAGLAGCSVCFRRLGLWMYKPKSNGDAALYDSLDVVGEHMEYCPWVSGKAQSGSGRTSEKSENLRCGWELLGQALNVRHRRQIRSTVSVSGGSRAVSEAPSTDELVVDDTNHEARKASDREWWAKLRRMRQVLSVNSLRKKSAQ
ncbi:C3HC zinc finger domain protein [Aspergillus heteromorphus CBS 117.55]|uniref:C3HC zinc finger domain protein n=1 Tax=Aspergillus heteromorphus CBS 117.55 TaxID=1448321 RepID=A0A317VWZ7_9EURO|nr:C3HC zinc finger domain protein [Aspergillus heteromorphus CBS 117.55]PWY78295.1 C3HC zinc finger domain protein [Aspergillus heteromorphus CBS 117.55]